jgi:hypothetical protein
MAFAEVCLHITCTRPAFLGAVHFKHSGKRIKSWGNLRIYQYIPWDGIQYPRSEFRMVYDIPALRIYQYMAYHSTLQSQYVAYHSTSISHDIASQNIQYQGLIIGTICLGYILQRTEILHLGAVDEKWR